MPIQHLLPAAVLLCALAHTSSEKPCEDQTICEYDISSSDGVRSSAMLQVKIEPTKTESSSSSLKKRKMDARTRNHKSLSAPKARRLYQHHRCVPEKMELHHIKESKDCVSAELMEAYLKAVHHHAEFLPAKERDGGNLVEKQLPPNIEAAQLDPLSQFTKTEGGDIPSYCKQAYAGLHRHDASSPEECARECLKDRNCRHFMWHKGDISQAKCRLSHMCMVYTESKDNIDGYLLNWYTTTTTTTTAELMYSDDATTTTTATEEDQEPAENADEDDNTPDVNIGNEENAGEENAGDENEENAGDENDVPPVSGADDDEDDQESSSVAGIDGASVPLDAGGFKEATSLCCPSEMEVFFIRLLDDRGYDVCSTPHIQGLVHWFTCVPDMNFQYMLDVIENGNPCKYWSKRGEECQALSDKCVGKFCR